MVKQIKDLLIFWFPTAVHTYVAWRDRAKNRKLDALEIAGFRRVPFKYGDKFVKDLNDRDGMSNIISKR